MGNSISRKKNKNFKIIKKENILNLPKKKKKKSWKKGHIILGMILLTARFETMYHMC